MTGLTGATDPVWMQGNQHWLPAARMPGLVFPVQRISISAWLKRNRIVLASVVFAVMALIVAPTWYVLALNANRMGKLREQQEAEAQREQLVSSKAIAAQDRQQRERIKRDDDRLRYTELLQKYELELEGVRERSHERVMHGLDADALNRQIVELAEKIDGVKGKINEIDAAK
jgi:hypothetical protein